jgi:hypothetical protein
MRSIGSPYVDKDKDKKPLQKEVGNAQPEQKLAKNTDRAGNRTIPIKGYLFKLAQQV